MSGARPYDFAVLAIGVAAVSTAAIFIRQADAPAAVIAAYRLALASVPMLAFTAYRRERMAPTGGVQAGLTLLAGIALALHFVFWIESLKQTSVITSVVLVATSPLFVALASGPLLGEKPSRNVWIGLAVAITGTCLMVADDLGKGADTVRGDLYALLGAMLAAVFFLIGRRLLAGGGSWLAYSTSTYVVAAFVLVALALAGGNAMTGFSSETYVYLVLLALVPQIIGHTAFNRSLRYMPAFAVAIAVQGEPVGATILAAVFLSELPTALQLLGGLVVLAGVYVGLRPGHTGATVQGA